MRKTKLLLNVRQVFGLKYKEKLAVVIAAVYAVYGGNKIAYFIFNIRKHRVAMELAVCKQVIVIIHLHQAYGRHVFFVQAGIVQGLRPVQPVLEGEPLFALYALYGHADKLEGAAVA